MGKERCEWVGIAEIVLDGDNSENISRLAKFAFINDRYRWTSHADESLGRDKSAWTVQEV